MCTLAEGNEARRLGWRECAAGADSPAGGGERWPWALTLVALAVLHAVTRRAARPQRREDPAALAARREGPPAAALDAIRSRCAESASLRLMLMASLLQAFEAETGVDARSAAIGEEAFAAAFAAYLDRRLAESAGPLPWCSVEDLAELVRESLQWPPLPLSRRGAAQPLPATLPQQTFPEAKALAIALADGPRLRHWLPIEGELALRHKAGKDATLETKLVGTPLLDWLGLPGTVASLREELRRAGIPAALLAHVAIGLGLEHAERGRLWVQASLDELIAAIGWTPRWRAEREQMRRQVWRWLLLLEAMPVIGQRRGRFRDPATKEVIDTRTTEALLRIGGRTDPAQLAFDASAPPLEVAFAPGPWVEACRGDHRLLAYFGNVRRIAAIPAGKVAGAWAQAIGLALYQLWREQAADAIITRAGEENRLTVRFPVPFTRRRLLDLFPPKPTAEEVLHGPHPQRAKAHWTAAIRILRTQGIVGTCTGLAGLSEKRQDWQAAWLDQPLDIRPAEEGKQAIAEIARRAQAARKARARRQPASRRLPLPLPTDP